MDKVIYRRTIIGAAPEEGRELPTVLYVTEETNGFAAFLESPEVGREMLKWFNHGKDAAIEWGVHKAMELTGANAGRKVHS